VTRSSDSSRFDGEGYLAIRKFEGIVVIHSLNEVGAKIMQGYLPQARLEPFGTFDIEHV
jgi:hypothetical protein